MDPTEVRSWRKAQRQRLLALRIGTAPAERRLWGQQIDQQLRALLLQRPGIVLGVYWPFQAEFDPRLLIDWLIAAGSLVALPVVVDKQGPLEYRAWRPGEKLVDGVWKIPIPEKRQVVVPQAVLAPLVGFEFSQLETIYPQDFDIPMDQSVTEAGIRGP